MLINLLAWLIVGGFAGWLVSKLAQGADMGMVGDIVVGIIGGLIGGGVVSLLVPDTFGLASFNVTSLVVAFISAVSLLFVVNLFMGRRAVL